MNARFSFLRWQQPAFGPVWVRSHTWSKLWAAWLCLAPLLAARGQQAPALPQPARLELPGDASDHYCRVLPLPADSSLVVYTEDSRHHEGDALRHAFRAYDHQLRLRWTSYVHLPAGTGLQAIEADGNAACALFVTARDRELVLVSLAPATGQATVRRFLLQVGIAPLAFSVRGPAAYVIAWAYQQQTVLRLPLATRGPDTLARFLPTLSSPATSVSDLLADAGGLTVLLAERPREQARLLVRPFDSLARPLLAPPPVQSPWPLRLTAGRLAPLAAPGAPRLLLGTYATRDPRYAQGLFSTLVPAEGTLPAAEAGANLGQAASSASPIRYYDLPTLPHFYDRYRPHHRARAGARAVRRRQQGRETVSRARLLLHRPLLVPGGGYVLVAEHYYPRYRAGDSWGYRAWSGGRPAYGSGFGYQPFAYGVPGLYGPYDPLNVWDRGFDGYVYTQALVLAFDGGGQLRWQQSFVLADVVRRELAEQVVATLVPGGPAGWQVALAQLHGNGDDDEVRYGIVSPTQAGPPPLLSAVPRSFDPRERVNATTLTQLLPWRPGYMLAAGYQRIGRPAGVKGGPREVFFVNSLQPEPAGHAPDSARQVRQP